MSLSGLGAGRCFIRNPAAPAVAEFGDNRLRTNLTLTSGAGRNGIAVRRTGCFDGLGSAILIMTERRHHFGLAGITSRADTMSLSGLSTGRCFIRNPVIPAMAECGGGSFGSGFGTASRTGRCGITARCTGRFYGFS